MLRLLFSSAFVWLSLGLCEASPIYDRQIQAASDRYFGVESDWYWHKARIRVESNFDPSAKSHAGAVGLTQFIWSTAQEYGAKSLADRLDPTWSIDAMVRYIRDIWNLIEARSDTVVPNRDHQMLSDAGYNWGQGRVVRLCLKKGFAWIQIERFVPKETRGYSPLIQKWRERYSAGLSP